MLKLTGVPKDITINICNYCGCVPNLVVFEKEKFVCYLTETKNTAQVICKQCDAKGQRIKGEDIEILSIEAIKSWNKVNSKKNRRSIKCLEEVV